MIVQASWAGNPDFAMRPGRSVLRESWVRESLIVMCTVAKRRNLEHVQSLPQRVIIVLYWSLVKQDIQRVVEISVVLLLASSI